MSEDAARLAHICAWARWLALLCLSVVGVSAYLRLAGASLGCADWPACYGSLLNSGHYAPPPMARLAHRVVATSALLLALYLAWRTFWPTRLAVVGRSLVFIVGTMLLLAVVGIWSADPRLVSVNFINILGGIVLVPMAWRVVRAEDASDPAVRDDPGMRLGIVLLGCVVALGAAIGASYAAVGNDILHWAHRVYAAAAVTVLVRSILRKMKAHPRNRSARLALTLLVIEMGLGISMTAIDFPLTAAVAHNLVAAILLAAMVQMKRTETDAA